MTEERISTLESLVTDLRINEGRYTAAIEHLTKSVNKLTEKVDQLTAAMDRGKGAAWALGSGGGIVGAAIVWVSQRFFGG